MRILLYNWIQDFDPEKRGGGVRIYQGNLIGELIKRGEYEVYTLYSGVGYSFFRDKPFIKKIRLKSKLMPEKAFFSKIFSYEIINSDVLAPAHFCFGDTENLFEYNDTFNIFNEFLEKHGPFDVIHFNNLEGLPFSVLELKNNYPKTKFIFSAHNYYAVCPQVNLWRNETEHCYDYKDGILCETCINRPNKKEILFANRLAYTIKKIGFTGASRKFRKVFRVAGEMRHKNAYPKIKKIIQATYWVCRLIKIDIRSLFKKNSSKSARIKRKKKPVVFDHGKYRRDKPTYLLNTFVDRIIAVSNQAKDVITAMGVKEELIAVSYIGTMHYERFMKGPWRIAKNNAAELSICYMGYMRRDKGFSFLVETLEKMPLYLSKKIRVKIIAPVTDQHAFQRLKDISPKYAHLEVINGYQHDELDSLLEDCDVGIVPVLWQDNLPQIAIEIVSRGVPIITSHLGGAKELGGNNEEFIFLAGAHRGLIRKISGLISGEIQLSSYWKKASSLVNMQEHVDELLSLYNES